jgi:hypothetical protein
LNQYEEKAIIGCGRFVVRASYIGDAGGFPTGGEVYLEWRLATD